MPELSSGESGIRVGLAHVSLVNNETGEAMDFMINPADLREVLSVKWSVPSPIMRAPGGPLQYEGTEPKEFTIRAAADRELFPDRDIMDWRSFLDSLCYPIRSGDTIADPPTVLFVWPGLLAMPVKIVGLSNAFDDFGRDLHPKSFVSEITMREYGDTIRWSDEERTRITITEGLVVE